MLVFRDRVVVDEVARYDAEGGGDRGVAGFELVGDAAVECEDDASERDEVVSRGKGG